MKRRFGTLSLVAMAFFLCTPTAGAQDLGPGFTKVKERNFRLCSRRDHDNLQLRGYPGRRRDDR